MALSPSWAFSGQAVDSGGDPHLAKGVHYRVLTNPLLGLPVVPLVIGRVSLGEMAKGHTRSDVIWLDSQGTTLTAPFAVTSDNPVTAHLPLGRTACWAAVEGRARIRSPLDPIGAGRHAPGFRVEGVVATPYGDAPVAIRSAAPYHVYASHLERIVVRGNGTVAGLTWLPASAVEAFEPFRSAPLPTPPGARYAGPADGRDQAFGRVKRGAPQRRGMHESASATTPAGCAPVDASDEVDRVAALTVEPATSLDRLINDTSAPQRLLTSIATVLDANANSLGTTQRFILMDLLHGVVDPGIARWMGFLDVDDDPPAAGVVIAYVVDALFAPDWKTLRRQGLDRTIPSQGIIEDGATAVKLLARQAPELEQHIDAVSRMGQGPYLWARIVLAATVGVPIDSPAAPNLDAPTPGDWLPTTPPTAQREITVTMEHLVPAAGLASAIAQPAGAPFAERNPKDSIGRRLLVTARPHPAAITATSGVLADRSVDEQSGTWQTSQVDWFGRWSLPAAAQFGPATRPRPPRPVVSLTTRPPVIAEPAATGALSGVVRVEVSVPPVSGLPSGGRLLASLALTSTSAAGSSQSVHSVTNPAAPPEVMIVEVAGPALLPTESGSVTVTAVWTDSGGTDSEVSEPRTATLHDPRPPAPVLVLPTLTYTARPEATGRARATLEWDTRARPGRVPHLRRRRDDVAGQARRCRIGGGRSWRCRTGTHHR